MDKNNSRRASKIIEINNDLPEEITSKKDAETMINSHIEKERRKASINSNNKDVGNFPDIKKSVF